MSRYQSAGRCVRQGPLAALAAHTCHSDPPPPEVDWGAPAAAAAAAAALAASDPVTGAVKASNPGHTPSITRPEALCRSAAPRLLQAALAVALRDGRAREAAGALSALLARRLRLFPHAGWRTQVHLMRALSQLDTLYGRV